MLLPLLYLQPSSNSAISGDAKATKSPSELAKDGQFDDKTESVQDALLSRAKKRALRRQQQIAELMEDIDSSSLSSSHVSKRDSVKAARSARAKLPAMDGSSAIGSDTTATAEPQHPGDERLVRRSGSPGIDVTIAHPTVETTELEEALFVDRVDKQDTGTEALYTYIVRNLGQTHFEITVELAGSKNIEWSRTKPGVLDDKRTVQCMPSCQAIIGDVVVTDNNVSWSLAVQYDWQSVPHPTSHLPTTATKSSELESGLFIDRTMTTTVVNQVSVWEFVVRNETEDTFSVSVDLEESDNVQWENKGKQTQRSVTCQAHDQVLLGVACTVDATQAWCLAKEYNWKKLLIARTESNPPLKISEEVLVLEHEEVLDLEHEAREHLHVLDGLSEPDQNTHEYMEVLPRSCNAKKGVVKGAVKARGALDSAGGGTSLGAPKKDPVSFDTKSSGRLHKNVSYVTASKAAVVCSCSARGTKRECRFALVVIVCVCMCMCVCVCVHGRAWACLVRALGN